MRFRGLSKKGSDDELADISFDELDDPSRTSKFGGLDSSWTTDLILNQMCSDLKGKKPLDDEEGLWPTEEFAKRTCL